MFSHYVFDDSAKNSRIKGDYSIIKLNELNRNVAEDKKVITSFIDAHKDVIAVEYTSKALTGFKPKWIEELKELCEKTVR